MNKKKILMITGSHPPDVCGVGDYTYNLYKALSVRSEIDIIIFYKSLWKLNLLRKYYNEIKKIKPDIVHLQYPTYGYGYSFLPLLLMAILPYPSVITIHEFSSRTYKARLFTNILLCFVNEVVVSNNEELNYIKNNILLKKKKVSVINIGSNIPQSKNNNRAFNLRYYDIVYFGHIRPLKGIESFIKDFKKLQSKFPSIKGAIIGQTLPQYQNYFEQLNIKSDNNLELIVNKSENDVSDYLANSKIAYLPFPDGVSYRRGSLIAATLNGCQIITTYSKSEVLNISFQPYVHLVRDNNLIENVVNDILKKEMAKKNVLELGCSFSWDQIALKHLDLYQSIKISS